MKKLAKDKKPIKLSDIDRKVLLDYFNTCRETGLRNPSKAAVKKPYIGRSGSGIAYFQS